MNQSKSSIKANGPYEEEESYENPVNISRAPGCADDYIDIRSEYAAGGINMSLGIINTSQDDQLDLNCGDGNAASSLRDNSYQMVQS